MKVSSVIFSTATVFLATRATASSDSAENVSDQLYKKGNLGAGKKWGKNKGCADPAGAVIGLLHCIEVEDAQCAVAAYDPEFLRIHNEKDTVPLDVFSTEFWEGVFSLVDFTFDVRFSNNPSKNRASVRYVETAVVDDGSGFGLPPSAEYPFGATFYQHEHGIVDVDDDCKLLFWDQYGDDKEQTDLDTAVGDLLCAVNPDSCSG